MPRTSSSPPTGTHPPHSLHRQGRRPHPRHAGWAPAVAAAIRLGVFLALWMAGAAQAFSPPEGPTDVRTLRAQEIARCLPGEASSWPDGRDRAAPAAGVRLRYKHDGAPPWFSLAQVYGAVEQAAKAWAACGVPVRLQPWRADEPPSEGEVLVHWPAEGGAGHFGLAHLGQRTLTLGRGAFELLRKRNPAYPAHEVLQMVVSHEMGHFFGLMAHSRRCVDVMSYYTDAQGQACQTRDGGSHRRLPEYRALLPTACDIARCRAANGR